MSYATKNYEGLNGDQWVVGGELNVTGTLQFNGTATNIAHGSQAITGTADIDTGLTTIVSAVATLRGDPGATDGDVFLVTTAVSDGTLTINVWQDDATAATDAVTVDWIAIGS